MRFGLAAKLSLLAALLVFGTSVVVGTIFFRSARSVVQGREEAGLRDEADLCRKELLADWCMARPTCLLWRGRRRSTRCSISPVPTMRGAAALDKIAGS